MAPNDPNFILVYNIVKKSGWMGTEWERSTSGLCCVNLLGKNKYHKKQRSCIRY